MLESPHVSVILPVCHGGEFLRAALRSLARSRLPFGRMEVLVTGPPAAADARDIVDGVARETGLPAGYVDCTRSGRAAALNAACDVARGDLLVFSDDDCAFPPDWLPAVAEAAGAEEGLGVLGGPDQTAGSRAALDLALDWTLGSLVGSGRCRTGERPGAGRYYPRLWNMAVPRDVALAASRPGPGGRPRLFDESLSVHEDVDLARRVERLGKRIVFSQSVRVLHHRDTTVGSLLRRNFRMARAARAIGVHRAPHVVLAAALVALLLLVPLAFVSATARAALAAGAATYAGLLFLCGVRAAAAKHDLRMLAAVPALIAGLHASRAAGYLVPQEAAPPGEEHR
jgi:hypothetical protein